MTKNDIYMSMNIYIFIKYIRNSHEMPQFCEENEYLENKI